MSANILYGGVNFTVEGEGGPDCVNFLSESHRIIETVSFVVINAAILGWAARKVSLPHRGIPDIQIKTQTTERVIFATLLAVFLLEVRYDMWLL